MIRLRATICLLLFACSREWCAATEPEIWRVVPPDSAVVVEINRPGRIRERRFVVELAQILRESPSLKRQLESREVAHLRQAASFIEKSLGGDWHTGLLRLTSGGLVIAIGRSLPGESPDVTVVVTSENEATLDQFLSAIHAELKRKAADEGGKPPPVVETRFRTFDCYQVGNGHFAVVGRRLFAANRQTVLEAALDRFSGNGGPVPSFALPGALRLVDSAGDEPLVQATLSLALLRDDPETARSLAFPANDAMAVALLGGYLDLLRRADFATIGLFFEDHAIAVQFRVAAGADGAFTPLRGYFAAETGEAAAPLLRPERTIATASWFRDYARMWGARAELFAPQVVKELDDENARQRNEPGGLGIGDLVPLFGPHLRLVAARPLENVYRAPLDERLPALAVAIDLADEPAFREKVLAPINRVVPAAIRAQGGDVKSTNYRGAELTSLRFAEPEAATVAAPSFLYQFNPAYTVTRGHLVVGSTAELVRGVIDELDRIGAAREATRQLSADHWWSLAELGLLVEGYRARYTREVLARPGASTDEGKAEAEADFNTLLRLLKWLGNVTITNQLERRHFDLKFRLQLAEPSGDLPQATGNRTPGARLRAAPARESP